MFLPYSDGSTKNENSVIIYSPSCCKTQKMFWRSLLTKWIFDYWLSLYDQKQTNEQKMDISQNIFYEGE